MHKLILESSISGEAKSKLGPLKFSFLVNQIAPMVFIFLLRGIFTHILFGESNTTLISHNPLYNYGIKI